MSNWAVMRAGVAVETFLATGLPLPVLLALGPPRVYGPPKPPSSRGQADHARWKPSASNVCLRSWELLLTATSLLLTTTYCLLLTTTYYLLLTIGRMCACAVGITTHYLLLTTYYSLLTTYYLLLTTYYLLLLTTDYYLLRVECAPPQLELLLTTTYYLLPTTDY